MPGYSFRGFYGQKPIVTYLKSQLEGAQALGDPCPHILVLGPSGMGKTRLIRAISQEAGTCCWVIHGKATPKDICTKLINLQKGDFLFLDEAHTLPRESQEYVYEVIDNFVATNKVSAGTLKTMKSAPKQTSEGKLIIPPCTLAFATNEPSGLLAALVRRMELVVCLTDYAKQELMDIATQEASKQGLLLGISALKRISVACLGTPDGAYKIVQGMKRLYHADCHRIMTDKDVKKYLKSTGRDNNGLSLEQRKFLGILHKQGHASINTLASLLGLEATYAEDKIETGLIKLGLVQKASGGRRLTREGIEWIRKKRERELGKGNRLMDNLSDLKKKETE
jgi:Holliday junction DNA helicase RuvB